MGRHSSSDSDYSRDSHSRHRKKKRSKKRSRSNSPERSRPSSHSKSKRRSRSRDSDRSDAGSRSRRSHSRERSSRRSSRRSRSRSRKRSRSSDRSYDRRSKKSRDRSSSPPRRRKHVDAVLGTATGTMKDMLDIVPGFSKMTPAEQSKIRIQKALKAAVDSSKRENDDEAENTDSPNENAIDAREQIGRLNAIREIADSGDESDEQFIPTHFKSSSSKKKKLALNESKKAGAGQTSFTERESTHELAIFGHSGVLSLDDAIQRKKDDDQVAMKKAKLRIDFSRRDPSTLVAKELLISAEEANRKWQDKLRRLRSQFLGEAQNLTAS